MKEIKLFFCLLLLPLSSIAPEFSREHKVETWFDQFQNRRELFLSQDFSYKTLREYLWWRNPRNADIIRLQAILETGFFTSEVFLENNNLFGMKLPRVRRTTAIGENRGHAVYETWMDSVDDYILWYNYMTRNRVYTNYFDFLRDVGYAEDPYYLRKLLILKET